MSHWYQRDGKACYTVIGSNGKERETTLRDARKLDLVRSVTTIGQAAAKPGLQRWKEDQLLEAAIKHHNSGLLRTGQEKEIKQWKGMVFEESEKISKQAAMRGTELHGHLEQYFLDETIDEKDKDFIIPVIELMKEKDLMMGVQSELSFAHPDGFGGKSDVINKVKNYILDFKTKDKEVLDKSILYDDYPMQLAAYRKGFDMPTATCYNIFVSTRIPGVIMLHKWEEEDLERGLKMFNALLTYCQVRDGI